MRSLADRSESNSAAGKLFSPGIRGQFSDSIDLKCTLTAHDQDAGGFRSSFGVMLQGATWTPEFATQSGDGANGVRRRLYGNLLVDGTTRGCAAMPSDEGMQLLRDFIFELKPFNANQLACGRSLKSGRIVAGTLVSSHAKIRVKGTQSRSCPSVRSSASSH